MCNFMAWENHEKVVAFSKKYPLVARAKQEEVGLLERGIVLPRDPVRNRSLSLLFST
jgi:hypothetical protein